MTIIFAVWVAAITWWLLHLLVYNHKNKISRLWKNVHRLAVEMSSSRDESGEIDPLIKNIYTVKMDREGKLINALLDYDYPMHISQYEEEDQEYVRENRYEVKIKSS